MVSDFSLPRRTRARLAFCSRSTGRGGVDGAWWPSSTDLGAELPDLVAVVGSMIGEVRRVVYDPSIWPPTPSRVIRRGVAISVDPYTLVNERDDLPDRHALARRGALRRSAVVRRQAGQSRAGRRIGMRPAPMNGVGAAAPARAFRRSLRGALSMTPGVDQMSRFCEVMYANARTSTRGMVTGEPDAPVRHSWGEVHRAGPRDRGRSGRRRRRPRRCGRRAGRGARRDRTHRAGGLDARCQPDDAASAHAAHGSAAVGRPRRRG